MIWTLICFAIMFFVLKKFAFGRIQTAIDERRERIRQSIEEADRAREEAHKLLEEHQALVAQGRARGRGDPRRGAEGRRRAARPAEGGARRRARAPRRGDPPRDRGRDAALDRADPLRGRRPDARGDLEGHRQGPRRRGPPPPDRGGDRRPRLLRAGAGDGLGAMAVVHRVYARALYDAAKEQGIVERDAGGAGDFVAAVRDVPELRAVLRNPQIDPRAKSAALDAITDGVHDIVRNFLRLLAEKGRIGEVEEMERELERLVAARAGPDHRRADDGAGALRRGGARDRRPDREGVRPQASRRRARSTPT